MRRLTLLVSCAYRASAFVPVYYASLHASTALMLNRLLLTQDEVLVDSNNKKVAVLPKDDYRTIHASKILGLQNGDNVRAGLCDRNGGLSTDSATVEWITPIDESTEDTNNQSRGEPSGSLRINLHDLKSPPTALDTSAVSLILALPRPLQLGRMLPMISQMGVDKIVLTHAKKVPREYFGSHLLRKPELLDEKIIEGLCQAGDVRLPKVQVCRNLGSFLKNDLDDLFPLSEYARVVAHPQRNAHVPTKRLRDVVFPTEQRRLVIAVGPEGGWEEPLELENFESLGFQQVSMGARILRSDCAVVSLLGLAHDVCNA